MDVLTFIATLITAWPIAVVALAIIFRSEIRLLLGRIRSAKAGSAELLFEQGVLDAENSFIVRHPLPAESATAEAPSQTVPPSEVSSPATEGVTPPKPLPEEEQARLKMLKAPKYPIEASELRALAIRDPRVAIVFAWNGVEEALWRAVEARGYAGPRTDVNLALRFLTDRRLNSAEQIAEFNKLRRLRNVAVHDADFNPSFESVERYLLLAEDMQWGFQMLSRTTPME